MDGYREENPSCYIHTKEIVVGVCALCLKERLLILASKQGHVPSVKDTHRSHKTHQKRPSITLSKVFALASFRHRPEFHYQRSSDGSDGDAPTSHEDSFISIKFEEDGQASWAHKAAHNNIKTDRDIRTAKSVVEHPRLRPSLRWHKRIGQLFHHIRWKRSTKTNACHVGSKGEGVKGRNGWIRAITRRAPK